MNDQLSVRKVHPELAPIFSGVIIDGQPTPRAPHAGAPDLASALLEDACRLGASDIHIEPHREGARVRIRLDGEVRDVTHLASGTGKVLVNQLKALANLDPIVRFTPREAHARFQSTIGPVDLRLALAPVLDRDTVSIRLLDPHRLQRSISELGLSDGNLRLLSEWLEEINACSSRQVRPAAERQHLCTPCFTSLKWRTR